jgi:ADP-heptose:LPS heptosyltransferase
MTGYDLTTALIAYLINADIRLGFPGYGREVLFNKVARSVDNDRHIVDLTLDLVRTLNCRNGSMSPKVFVDRYELEWAESWLKQHNHSNRPLLGIHPGGYYETQRWPAEHYATLLKMLSNKSKKIILFGGPADKNLVDEITSLSGEDPLIFVSPDLRKTMAVMSMLKLLVCNNSGPLHIASALKLPTVSFMGPTNKVRWSPIGKQHTVLQVDGLECLGCEEGKCLKGSIDCMWRILPEEAFNAVNEVLNLCRSS